MLSDVVFLLIMMVILFYVYCELGWKQVFFLFKDIVSCLYYEETRLQARIQRFYLSNKWHIISTVNSLLFIFGKAQLDCLFVVFE